MQPRTFIVQETTPVNDFNNIVRQFPSGLKIVLANGIWHALLFGIPTIHQEQKDTYVAIEDLKKHAQLLCKALLPDSRASREVKVNAAFSITTHATKFIADGRKLPPLFNQVVYSHFSGGYYLQVTEQNYDRMLSQGIACQLSGKQERDYAFGIHHASLFTFMLVAMQQFETVELFAKALENYPKIRAEFETVFGIPLEKLVCG